MTAFALLAGCDREARDVRGKPFGETVPGPSPDTIFPGGAPRGALDPRLAAYGRNAYAISQGQQLFIRMNCVGCHAHGGGGMGPALMDDQWTYGSTPTQIFASIAEGRANGMPTWKYRLTNEQIWQLVAYVRSLSGLTPKGARPTRSDEMNVKPAPSQTPNAKPKRSGPKSSGQI